MGDDLFVEFSAKDNNVFEVVFGERSPFFGPVIPNLGLAEEIESGPLDDARSRPQRIGPEENRGAEDALKGGNQPSIFPAAFTHAKDVQHFGRRLETNRWRFLLNGERGQENGNKPVLSERHAIIGMSGNLQDKVAVSSFIEELRLR